VEMTTVRAQPPKPSLVRSVHFTNVHSDGIMTMDSVLDLATRPYSGASFKFHENKPAEEPIPAHHVASLDSFNDSSFDPISNDVFDDTSGDTLNSPDSLTKSTSADTPPNDLSGISEEVIASFFEIDVEDEVINPNTGEKKAPKRPHQVCRILNL
jgi:hypothetical protein